MPKHFIKQFLRLILYLTIAPLLWTAPLVPLRTTAMGRVPVGAEGRLLVVDGRPLVITESQAWLQDKSADWQQSAWQHDGSLAAIFGNGQAAFVLIADSPSAPSKKLMQLVLEDDKLSTRPLPLLPIALTSARGTVKGTRLFLHGNDKDGNSHLLQLSFNRNSSWSVYPGVVSTAGSVEALVAQDDSLYAVETPADGSGQRLYHWSVERGWSDAARLPGKLVPGAARAIGQAHMLFVVGSQQAQRVVTYYTITRVWAELGEVDFAGIHPGMAWGNGLLLGQVGEDELALSLVELLPTQHLLQPLDWLMIVLYLTLIAGIGVYCYRREKKQSTTEFFVGSRTIPFWAAGISLYATNSSAIGYIATTAKAFATNWQYFLNNIIGVLGLIFVAIWIVPMLRRLQLMSVFSYLDQRFHRSVRLAASALCIVMHVGGRMSVILFLPSLVISTVTGLNVIWSILIMGLVTIGYTALGGMRAVIWTDLVQVIVKVGGLIFALIFIVSKLRGGVNEFFVTATANDKMRLLDWHFDLTQPTVWSIVFLVIVEVVLTFPKDQVLMQRVFTTTSAKEAGRSIWMFAALIIPGSLLFYLIGTGLYVFYHSNPERMNPLLSVDATFPLFIAAELPVGVTGLMIAGLFSAAMATLSSILNSVATMVSVDFYEKIAKKPDQAYSIRLAEWVTVLTGVVGICLAILLSRFDIKSLFDTAAELWGLLGGASGGAYTLGMFSRRANWQGVLIGMAASFLITFAAWTVNMVHPLLYLAVASLVSIVVGYAASWLFPAPSPESLYGLTIYNQRNETASITA